MKTSDHVRLATLELQSPPVPRRNKNEERVLRLIREKDWTPALESLGETKVQFVGDASFPCNLKYIAEGADDSESNWKKWRILTVEQRQKSGSYLSSQTWPLHGSISPFSRSRSQCQSQESTFLQNSTQEILNISMASGSSLPEGGHISPNNDSGLLERSSISTRRPGKTHQRFAYPHQSEEELKESRIRRAEHNDEWTHVQVKTIARRDVRLISPNEEERSRSKSSFATLPYIDRDGVFGPPLKPTAASSLRCFDTLSIKMLNSPNYPAIARSLRMFASADLSRSGSSCSNGLGPGSSCPSG